MTVLVFTQERCQLIIVYKTRISAIQRYFSKGNYRDVVTVLMKNNYLWSAREKLCAKKTAAFRVGLSKSAFVSLLHLELEHKSFLARNSTAKTCLLTLH